MTTLASGATPSVPPSMPAALDATGVFAQLPFDFLGSGQTALGVDAPAGSTSPRRAPPSSDGSTRRGTSSGSSACPTPRARSTASARPPTSPAPAVRRLDPVTKRMTTLAGTATGLGTPAVDGNAATARFGSVNGVAVAPNGDVVVADGDGKAIRRVDALGNVTTVSGRLGQDGLADGDAATARFLSPLALAYAPDGTLWVNDGSTLRRVAADGRVTTTTVTNVSSFVFDPAGQLYVLKPGSAAGGLYAVSAAGVETRLVPLGSGLVTGGTSPSLGTGDGAMAMLGPKQIAIVAARTLVVVTLP